MTIVLNGFLTSCRILSFSRFSDSNLKFNLTLHEKWMFRLGSIDSGPPGLPGGRWEERENKVRSDSLQVYLHFNYKLRHCTDCCNKTTPSFPYRPPFCSPFKSRRENRASRRQECGCCTRVNVQNGNMSLRDALPHRENVNMEQMEFLIGLVQEIVSQQVCGVMFWKVVQEDLHDSSDFIVLIIRLLTIKLF